MGCLGSFDESTLIFRLISFEAVQKVLAHLWIVQVHLHVDVVEQDICVAHEEIKCRKYSECSKHELVFAFERGLSLRKLAGVVLFEAKRVERF